MDASAIYARLTDVFHDVFDSDEIVVTPELTAQEVEGWDSLAQVRLVLTVEKAFGVKFSAGEAGKMKNVGEFADLIAAKVNKKP